MTPPELADLHKAAFAPARGWSASEFQQLCDSPHVTCYTAPMGFALVRSVAGDAELLTLAVHPDVRREGRALALMHLWLDAETAEKAFLEVAADNKGARALYLQLGFTETGRRAGYYQRPDGARVDALLMELALTPVHAAETLAKTPKTG